MTAPMGRAAALVAAFAGALLVANWLTNSYGLVPVGFGLVATAGTYSAGLTFGLRDALHEVGGRAWVLAAIAGGAVLSWAVAPQLAAASAVAFTVAEVADLAVYEPLRRRRWVLAVVASNLVGALADTVLFLWLAGFPIRDALAGQLVGKAWAILPALVLVHTVRGRR